MTSLLDSGECSRGHTVRGATLQTVHRADGRVEYRCALCHRARQRAYHARQRQARRATAARAARLGA